MIGPSLRRRAAAKTLAGEVARLQSDLADVRDRHSEQIERLEDLVRELVLTAESLRRAASRREHGEH
jgi:hypothetical protein